MTITTNKFVSVSYDLNVGEDDERELMERATTEHPLQFIFGVGAMLPSFEQQLKGLAAGDTFRFTLAPKDAYGEYMEENVVELPKKIFEIEGAFDEEFIKEGNTVPMMDSEGQQMNGSVLEVKDDTVLMDFNHPLAGETLHFNGHVLDVHEATAEDIAGLAAGGCGCDCADCEDGDCDCEDGTHSSGCGSSCNC
ncbi:MAG: peptidylprolyl isomerase [Tannerella sp.]|jgi:FKBP-type peptidyl-prolyl cis-trans isomerase SlyD|nr:peptidylprolyl isomerase [Tannerella sp.]